MQVGTTLSYVALSAKGLPVTSFECVVRARAFRDRRNEINVPIKLVEVTTTVKEID